MTFPLKKGDKNFVLAFKIKTPPVCPTCYVGKVSALKLGGPIGLRINSNYNSQLVMCSPAQSESQTGLCNVSSYAVLDMLTCVCMHE